MSLLLKALIYPLKWEISAIDIFIQEITHKCLCMLRKRLMDKPFHNYFPFLLNFGTTVVECKSQWANKSFPLANRKYFLCFSAPLRPVRHLVRSVGRLLPHQADLILYNNNNTAWGPIYCSVQFVAVLCDYVEPSQQ